MDLLATLRELEQRLHRPEVRSHAGTVAEFLHPAFREFGRSGATYTREQILSEFTASQEDTIWSQDYALEPVAEDVALLTYRSAHVGPLGALERHTLRSSLWQRTEQGWKMRFHQGTPTAPFEKRED